MTETVNIEELVQDQHNFNKGTEEGARLMEKSFTELGAGRSILIDKDGHIIAGNKSQKAAMAAGIKKVRVIESDGTELIAVKRTDISIDSKEGRELALADNLTTQVNLAWDNVELASVAAEQGIDLPDWGLDPKDLGIEEPTETKEAQEDDFDEEKDKVETVCKKGDIWQLGNHRLMCGSCTDADAMDKLMDGERADITFTSPPYNVQLRKDDVKYTKGSNMYNEYEDNKSDEDYYDLLDQMLQLSLKHSDDSLLNIGLISTSFKAVFRLIYSHIDKYSEILVWNRGNAIPIGIDGVVKHYAEFIFCFNNRGNRAFSHPQFKRGMASNVIDASPNTSNEYAKHHHATFPVEFASKAITQFTEKSVLDTFGGTGTTLIAAEQLGRKCFMMELDPHYCDIIIARWEKLTGQTATKL